MGAATAGALLLGACSDGGTGVGSWVERAEALPPITVGPDAPADLIVVDAARWGAAAGEDVTTPEGWAAFVGPTVAPVTTETVPFERLGRELTDDVLATAREELGYAPTDLDWWVDFRAPPDAVAAAGGRLDPDVVASAALTVAEGEEAGVPDLGRSSPLRPTGERAVQTVDGDVLTSARTDPSADGAVLDRPGVADVLAGLDAAEAYAGFVRSGVGSFVAGIDLGAVLEGQEGELPDTTDLEVTGLPEPFTAVGGGLVWRDGAAVPVFVHAHDSAEAAEANAAALEAVFVDGVSEHGVPWSELVADPTATVDDTTVTTTLTFTDDRPPQLVFQLLLERVGPFAHE